MEYQEGQTATNPKTGVKIVFRGGAWHNAGAAGNAVATPESIKLTEDQGKSQGYARLMNTAETQFQEAERQGYDPGDARNIVADFAEGLDLPLIGKPIAGMAPFIRDDVSDAAVKAKRAWQDAQLKAMTGAGQSAPEMVENPRTYFPQPGEGEDAANNAADVRATAYASARTRAGPQGANLPRYQAKTRDAAWWESRPAPQLEAARRYRGGDGMAGGAKNPYVIEEAEYDGLPSKAYFIGPDGALRRKP